MKRDISFFVLIILILLALFIGASVLTTYAQDASPTPEVPMLTNTPAAVVTPEATLAVAPIVPTVAPIIVEVQPIPTAPPDNSFTLKDLAVTIIIVAGLAGFTVLGRTAIIQLGQSAPEWLYQTGVSAVNTLENAAGSYVTTTTTTIDDAVYAELKKQLDAMKDEIAKLRQPAA